MNAADMSRLELAKRAYQAAQPNEAEIQTGVRRARLSLGKPRPRRAWFSKGLVFIVLAIGSLAYAKPHALGELVERVLPHGDANGVPRGVGVAALSLPMEAPPTAGNKGHRTTRNAGEAAAQDVTDATTQDASNASRTAMAPPLATAVTGGPPSKKPKQTTRSTRATATATATATEPNVNDTSAISDWGRVGQALARGDETQALATLGELSHSDDQRTRDKADVGRAQLLMAHGSRDRACALARSLTNRRAGSRIERQAQELLKSCLR